MSGRMQIERVLGMTLDEIERLRRWALERGYVPGSEAVPTGVDDATSDDEAPL